MILEFKCSKCKQNVSMLISNWNLKMMNVALFLRSQKLCYSCIQKIRKSGYEMISAKRSGKIFIDKI